MRVRARQFGIRGVVAALPGLMLVISATSAARAAADFPAGDTGYHTYTEMSQEIHDVAAAHPDLVRVFSIGTSYEGRQIWAAKVSDNVTADEAEPEALLDGLHHADEHMSVEMELAILHWLVDGYGTDPRITSIVDRREIWLVFMVNPDGGQYDIKNGHYHDWRKNRQPTPGSDAIGTDLNRNYGYHWGCCGGSSGDPSSRTYRGPHAWSAPEVRAMRDFVLSRRVDGVQQIRVHISFHTQGRKVLYGPGYTLDPVPPDMTLLDHRVLVTMATHMAATNGYVAQQASHWYITDGSFGGWLYPTQRSIGFTIEMTASNYPSDELIPKETGRNREAVLYLLEEADCPYRVLGATARQAYCGPYFDDLEVARGWQRDPVGSDTASDGAWARGVPQASPRQRSDAVSGQGVLVTGLAAGHDLDGGRSTIRSPLFGIPGGGGNLHLSYWLGLGANATAADGFRVRLVDASGHSLASLATFSGDGMAHAPTWHTLDVDLTAWAGQQGAIQLEAWDLAGHSTVEVGVDQVRVGRP